MEDEQRKHAQLGLVHDKTALIVGASGVIGSAVARLFVQHGATVCIHYFKHQHTAQALADELSTAGRPCTVHQADITDAAEATRLVQGAIHDMGHLDILVNCAGIARDGAIQFLTDSEWDEVMSTNVYGPFAVCKPAIAHMSKRRSGKIINVASVTGSTGQGMRTNYGASKGALMSLTKSMAHHLAPLGVQVNAIAPQIIRGGVSATASPTYLAETAKITPAGRLGEAVDVAGPVLFLASPLADFVVGEVLFVTGGLVTHRV